MTIRAFPPKRPFDERRGVFFSPVARKRSKHERTTHFCFTLVVVAWETQRFKEG